MVRISLPPGPVHHPDQVSISTFRPDGWLGGTDSAALIRVASGPAQVLVTIYQAPGQGAGSAPRLQVLRLNPELPAEDAPVAPAVHSDKETDPTEKPEVLVHVQAVGDMPGRIGEWAGNHGSGKWIEGFSILAPAPLQPEDIEYQAVLGRNWLSPWVHGGQFCGSRGMALPLLGLRFRLKGDAASQYDCECHASFVDGTGVGPLPADAACEAESLAPLEAFRITLVPHTAAKTAMPAGRHAAHRQAIQDTSPAKSALLKSAPQKANAGKAAVKAEIPAKVVPQKMTRAKVTPTRPVTGKLPAKPAIGEKRGSGKKPAAPPARRVR